MIKQTTIEDSVSTYMCINQLSSIIIIHEEVIAIRGIALAFLQCVIDEVECLSV